MAKGPLAVRWRNYLRFRRASRHAEAAGFAPQLHFLRQVADAFGLAFEPGEPLRDSRLRGRYEGLPIEIALQAREARVVTAFALTLPGPPRPGVIESLARRYYVHEQREALFAACEALLRQEQAQQGRAPDSGTTPTEDRLEALAAQRISWEDFGISDARLSCTVRYLSEVREVAQVLRALHVIAHTLTVDR